MASITIEQANKLFKVDPSLKGKEKYKKAKREYRRLAKEYHPDKGGTTKDFQIIQEAWDVFEENLNTKPKKDKNKIYEPHYESDRNIHTLFRETCEYISDRIGESLSLSKLAKDLSLSASEYYQIESWLSTFQYMRYIIGTKVKFVPHGLTLAGLEEAVNHVHDGNYGCVGYYDEPSIDIYRALAKRVRPKTIRNNHHFDFDLEDWEKE